MNQARPGRLLAAGALALLAAASLLSCAEPATRRQGRSAGGDASSAAAPPPAGAARREPAAAADSVEAKPRVRLALTSPAFADSQAIPGECTCDGRNVSPALAWRDPPPETATYALIMEGPDEPGRRLVHWIIYDIPAATTSLPAGAGAQAEPGGGRHGATSWAGNRYRGPCPDPGAPQRYYFQLFALKEPLNLPPEATWEEVVGAIKDKALDKAVLMGVYERPSGAPAARPPGSG